MVLWIYSYCLDIFGTDYTHYLCSVEENIGWQQKKKRCENIEMWSWRPVSGIKWSDDSLSENILKLI